MAALRSRVNRRLTALGKPLIVAIDDIDRLPPQDVREVLFLAKNNARFANLTYLLLMDRRLVATALGNGDLESGTELLDKIVDIPVSLEGVDRRMS